MVSELKSQVPVDAFERCFSFFAFGGIYDVHVGDFALQMDRKFGMRSRFCVEGPRRAQFVRIALRRSYWFLEMFGVALRMNRADGPHF